MYPKLSKHLLTNAIKEKKLATYYLGNKRHFYIKDIETFLTSCELKDWKNL